MLNKNLKLTLEVYREDGETTKIIKCDKVDIRYNVNEIVLYIRHAHDLFTWYEVETLELKKVIEIR